MRTIVYFLFCLMYMHSQAQIVQRCQYKVFNSDNGLGNQVVKSITEDENGFIWAMSDHHLQWFDGNNFHKVPFGTGNHSVPGVLYHAFYKAENNEVWIFYDKSFSVYDSKTHTFYHNKNNFPVFENNTIVPVGRQNDEVILYNGNDLLFLNARSKKITHTITSKEKLHTFYLNHLRNEDWFFINDSLHYTAFNYKTNQQKKLFVPNLVFYSPFKILNDSSFLTFSQKTVSLFQLNKATPVKAISYPGNKNLISYYKPQDILLKDQNTLLLSAENELWEFDISSFQFVRKYANLSGQDFFSNGYFKTLFYDSHGNLWAGSNLKGLYRINLKTQPIQLYATQNEKENFIKSFLVCKKNNIVVCGTYGGGIIIYDTAGNVLKKYLLNEKAQSAGALINSIRQINDNYALVLIYGSTVHYKLNLNTLDLQQLKVVTDDGKPCQFIAGYYSEPIHLGNEQFYFVGGNYKIRMRLKNESLIITQWNEKEIEKINWPPFIPVKFQKLLYYTGSNYFDNCLKKIGLQDIGAVCLTKKKNNWLIATIKGLYEFDKNEQLVHSYNISSGLPDENIYAAVADDDNNIWCSHDKGISKISSDGSVLNFTKADGLQNNEFNYAAVTKTEDGQLFFGGINGLNSFYPNQLINSLDTPKLIVTKIVTGNNHLSADTAFWSLEKLSFPYNNNRFKINFSAIGNFNSENYNFQYRIIGFDSEWKNLRHTQELNLALPPGNYTLQMAASGKFDKNIVAQKTIAVHITPPLFMQWWFVTLGLLLLTAFLYYFIRYFNKQKYKKRLQALQLKEQLENERQRISRDLHDNIGAYTSALLTNVEKMKLENAENAELTKMKSNAEQILSSLRETIWVLNNKEISVANFSDEFKTYCFKILRNFEDIHFESTEDIKNNFMLPAPVAIHLNKILQEIVQNTIKHSHASVIQYRICSDEQELKVSLADNGVGFDVNKASRGNGIENINWRAKEAGLGIHVSSSKEQGTKFTITKKLSG